MTLSHRPRHEIPGLKGIIAEPGSSRRACGAITGLNFTAGGLVHWCNTVGVRTASIDPGSPWQNGFIESFNAQFRREQLSGEIVDTMVEAKYLADGLKDIYNQERPHGSLEGMTPYRFWDEEVRENQLAIA